MKVCFNSKDNYPMENLKGQESLTISPPTLPDHCEGEYKIKRVESRWQNAFHLRQISNYTCYGKKGVRLYNICCNCQ